MGRKREEEKKKNFRYRIQKIKADYMNQPVVFNDL